MNSTTSQLITCFVTRYVKKIWDPKWKIPLFGQTGEFIFRLLPPVICWAGLAVSLGNFHLGDLGIMENHIQRTVAR